MEEEIINGRVGVILMNTNNVYTENWLTVKSITNNVIYNINGCDIVNSTLTNVIMKDIIGDRQYEMDPTDDIKS